MMRTIVVLLAVAISTVQAQVFFLGKCPDVSVVQNFNVQQYTGKWYEHSKYFAIFQLAGKCTTATYSLNPDNSVKVLNRQLNIITNQERTIEGVATLAGNGNEGKLTVTFSSVPFGGGRDSNYWVLGTDYSSYSVVYSCTDILGFFNIRFVWLLTREMNPNQNIIDNAYSIMQKNGVERNYLIKTDQMNC